MQGTSAEGFGLARTEQPLGFLRLAAELQLEVGTLALLSTPLAYLLPPADCVAGKSSAGRRDIVALHAQVCLQQ
jgi:hypothetical protein